MVKAGVAPSTNVMPSLPQYSAMGSGSTARTYFAKKSPISGYVIAAITS